MKNTVKKQMFVYINSMKNAPRNAALRHGGLRITIELERNVSSAMRNTIELDTFHSSSMVLRNPSWRNDAFHQETYQIAAFY